MVLLRHGSLWSQLFLGKGEDYVNTLLGRTKRSALDIVARGDVPAGIITQFSSRAEQIRTLTFKSTSLSDIIRFSELSSGHLPRLRTLEITSSLETDNSLDLLFGGSTNLERFAFHSNSLQCLSLFVFPNLTTFELSTGPVEATSALCLLKFLEASPMLKTVEMNINTYVLLGDVPQEMVVILPNVETFSSRLSYEYISVNVINHYDPTNFYDIATHISCPRAKYTSLIHESFDVNTATNLEIFPNSAPLHKIIHQYATTSQVEEVTLEIEYVNCKHIACSLTFQSSDTAIIAIKFRVFGIGSLHGRSELEKIGWEAFGQACETIRAHPRLSHVKRLHIKHRAALGTLDDLLVELVEQLGGLFGSLGPLDELTIHGCDQHIFLAPFLNHLDPRWLGFKDPIASFASKFPQVRELTISHPWIEKYERGFMDGIVELAASLHKRGKPFACMKVRARVLPQVEELRRWVGTVDLHEEQYWGG